MPKDSGLCIVESARDRAFYVKYLHLSLEIINKAQLNASFYCKSSV
jgi:hypothetical protein